MAGPAGEQNGNFLRVLGRGDVLALAFGAMIGFGWVVLSGEFLNGAGSLGAALAFVIGGGIVCLVGLTYAELVSAMPKAGGEHNYALRGLGAHGGFVASWGIVLGYLTVVAFEAVALPETVLYLVPDLKAGYLWTIAGYDVYATWAAVGSVSAVLITALNYIGIRPASVFQMVAVLFLVAVGAALLLGSFVGGSAANMSPLFSGGVGGLVGVLVATPFLFVGFDVIPQSAEEIKLPYRQVGRILVISVACATAWYILIMLTVSSALSREGLKGAQLASADGMAALWGSQAMGNVLIIGGIAGILTSWNAFLIGASRLLYAMAVSGMVPAWFGRLHPKYRTPSNALLFLGGLSVLAPLFGDQMLSWLVNAGGINIVVAYAVVAMSFLALRRREPGMERPFRIPAGAVVGGLALVLSLGLGSLYLPGMPAALSWPEWLIVGVWWLLGAVFMVRLPVTSAGPDSEERLLARLAQRKR
ncbi:amino acid/polyamine/organocation transporter (APC superfamily) [Murinocardiopsis flavida]|uniref:Amino acid/polyamine/organocation transporter (APC superfamily) n=1 Tax=Murinocardiopsis flavida TaxID=645275 RepID=A0A2P8DUE5_9ACTN|nr:APC family permease [Murinocardiopsis flavida]PSL00840.1 amino acid/polyamine/organocation transporter (APC superfamily) [Murinocardiopsis flavida]